VLESLLIANRGEIAVRVIRACRLLGIRPIAVYSDADAWAPHVCLADRAVRLGAAPAAESYLSIDAILRAARESGARAVHPGYGFLSERAEFARACEAAGVTFVGPSAATIAAVGDKVNAKRLAAAAGAPVIPGVDQGVANLAPAALRAAAAPLGRPAPRPAPRSATRTCTWSARSRACATWRCRSCGMRTATPWPSPSASARYSAVTRS
jgi:acetyl/propionyl-CoA carboxylase alpha subunit